MSLLVRGRNGVLEDVLGLEDVLEDTFWSPWPRSLKSSKIGLSSARGQHYFWTVEISLENARNLAKSLQRPFFWFPQVEIAWKKILKTFSPEKNFLRPFFLRSPEKKIGGPFIFWRTLASVFLVLGLERVCPRPWSRNFFVSLALVLSFVSSTPPLDRGCRYFSWISVRISFEVTLTCQLQAKYHLYHILFEPVLPSALKKISTKFRIFTKIVLNSEN